MTRTFFDRFFPHGAIDTQYSYVCVCVLKLSRYIKDITNKSFIEWVIDNRFFVCCKMCCCCFIHSFGLLNLKSEWVWATFGAQFFRNRFIRFHFISSCGSYWLWHKKTCCRYPHFFSSIVVRICASIFIFKRHSPPANWLWLSFVLIHALADHSCINASTEIGVLMLCMVDSVYCWCECFQLWSEPLFWWRKRN